MKTDDDVTSHFKARSGTYDASSSWCTDPELGALIVRQADPQPTDRVLDVACGTGLVSQRFKGLVAAIVGVDITPEMTAQAEQHLNELHIAEAEKLPFDDDSFDIIVCRQGLQFMTMPAAIEEMVRVVRPGGRIVLAHLCAYGPDDLEDYSRILHLRNPARRHVFLPDTLAHVLREAGCRRVDVESYVSREDVGAWADNGAISADRQQELRDVYSTASSAFLALHGVADEDGRLYDDMLFAITTGRK